MPVLFRAGIFLSEFKISLIPFKNEEIKPIDFDDIKNILNSRRYIG